jgi:hypothetical protein
MPINIASTGANRKRNPSFKGGLLSEPPQAIVVETAIEDNVAAKSTAKFAETMEHITTMVKTCTANTKGTEAVDVPDEGVQRN